MTRFEDGPAAEQVLFLQRAPLFLRVVESAGKLDALDQLDDEPRPGERIHVYRRHGVAGAAFVDYSGPRGRTGMRCSVARYRYVNPQPAAGDVTETAAWRTWCAAQPQQVTP